MFAAETVVGCCSAVINNGILSFLAADTFAQDTWITQAHFANLTELETADFEQ